MNIALLLRALSGRNGVSRVVLAHAREFSRLGHETHIYSALMQLTAAEREALPPGVHLHGFPCLRGSARIWTIPVGALRPYLGGHDLIVSHLLTVWQDVAVMHNDPQPVEADKLSAAPFTVCQPRLNSRNRAARTFVERQRFRPGRYKRVVALSSRSAAEISAACGVPREAISVIRHGVDPAHFYPEHRLNARAGARSSLGLAPEELVFLYIGDSWKGLEFAIRGAAAGGPKGRTVLLAAGPFRPGPFEALARGAGLRLIVHPGGGDARDLYSAADVFLNPTPLDTFSLSALEAMAMGLPAVISKYAGVSELLRDGENALVLDKPFETAAIAEAAGRLSSPGTREEIGASAAALARTLTWEKPAADHLRLYADISRRSGG